MNNSIQVDLNLFLLFYFYYTVRNLSKLEKIKIIIYSFLFSIVNDSWMVEIRTNIINIFSFMYSVTFSFYVLNKVLSFMLSLFMSIGSLYRKLWIDIKFNTYELNVLYFFFVFKNSEFYLYQSSCYWLQIEAAFKLFRIIIMYSLAMEIGIIL